MSHSIDTILTTALTAVDHVQELNALEQIRVQYLGKKGELTELLKSIASLPVSERPNAGQLINQAKHTLQQALQEKKNNLETQQLAQALAQQTIDVSLPGRGFKPGNHHPISRTRQRMVAFFEKLGFQTITGPEIEDDFHNFTALNFPENHPARDMQDTFFLDAHDLLLRTHTSCVQIRQMEQRKPPLRIIAPGRVYRTDDIDMTHTPMFHQLEGLYVDTHVTFAQLKGILIDFLEHFFERKLTIRFRPSFFPFTEPSAEVDIQAYDYDEQGKPIPGTERWLEVLGCGMVHPEVLKAVNIDSEKYRGFAFGMGIDRLTLLRYGIDDLRLMFENDQRFLQQF
ncbi:MAG: phenylalanine--tRNA ligase subunit alpha [Legionellales bacterium]|nr:phenylalanine--tRNA ligase subunit alpha [Legionellales bacterium]